MPVPSKDRDCSRILGIVVHPRFSGIAIVDRWGLVGRGCWIVDLRRFADADERKDALVRTVTRVMRRHHPAHVVVSTGYRAAKFAETVEAIEALSIARGATFTLGNVLLAVRTIVGTRPTGPSALPRSIVRAFFPELGKFVRNGIAGSVFVANERERYRRHAWHAIALALTEFAERHPRSAFALSRCNTGEFYALIARAELRAHPTL